MHVALYHNPNAGLQSLTLEEVAHLLREAHHDVESFIKGDHPADHAIDAHPDVIVAAGGDGTIASMAKALFRHESSIPLYVLPLGTANNIAWSLELADDVPRIIHGLSNAREATLDIGLIEVGKRKARFVEAAGSGFFGAAMHNDRATRARARRGPPRRLTTKLLTVDERVREGARNVARRVRRAPALSYEVHADGEDLSGEYIAIAAMNIRTIGPRMILAPDASSEDGLLDLVLVRPDEREALAELIESREAVHAPVVECRRVKDVELSWPGHGHLDDDPWPRRGVLKSDRRVHLHVGGSIRLLLPQF